MNFPRKGTETLNSYQIISHIYSLLYLLIHLLVDSHASAILIYKGTVFISTVASSLFLCYSQILMVNVKSCDGVF